MVLTFHDEFNLEHNDEEINIDDLSYLTSVPLVNHFAGFETPTRMTKTTSFLLRKELNPKYKPL